MDIFVTGLTLQFGVVLGLEVCGDLSGGALLAVDFTSEGAIRSLSVVELSFELTSAVGLKLIELASFLAVLLQLLCSFSLLLFIGFKSRNFLLKLL